MIDLNILNDEPAEAYHAKAKDFLSSHQLIEFAKCPYLYKKRISGLLEDKDSPAYFVGRAAHTRILEGVDAYQTQYAVGGPINPNTGKPPISPAELEETRGTTDTSDEAVEEDAPTEEGEAEDHEGHDDE